MGPDIFLSRSVIKRLKNSEKEKIKEYKNSEHWTKSIFDSERINTDGIPGASPS